MECEMEAVKYVMDHFVKHPISYDEKTPLHVKSWARHYRFDTGKRIKARQMKKAIAEARAEWANIKERVSEDLSTWSRRADAAAHWAKHVQNDRGHGSFIAEVQHQLPEVASEFFNLVGVKIYTYKMFWGGFYAAQEKLAKEN